MHYHHLVNIYMERIDRFVPFIHCLFYSWKERQSGMLLLGLVVEFPVAAGLTRP